MGPIPDVYQSPTGLGPDKYTGRLMPVKGSTTATLVHMDWGYTCDISPRVILIRKSFLDQIVHVPKLFPLLHWSQNTFCFLSSSTPSHGDKKFSASMGISMGK